jgi:hypothetical protein
MACSEDVENYARRSKRRGARIHIETIAERHEPKRSLAFVRSLDAAKAN